MEFNSYTGTISGGASHEVTISNGMAATSSRSAEFHAATDFEVPGDILSTAKTPSGSAIGNRPVQPTDIVKFHGQTMTVEQAVGLKFLTRDVAGNYAVAPQGASAGKPAGVPEGKTALASGGTAEDALASGFKADDATEAAFVAIGDRVSADAQIAAIDSVLGNEGQVDQRIVERMASQAGVEPGEMQERIEAARDGFEEAVYRHLEANYGVYDREAFARFVHSSPQTLAQMIAAGRDAVLTNSTVGFEKLAREATLTADLHDAANVEDALATAGIKFARIGNGGLVLDLTAQGKGQMTFRAAVEMGIIKLRRNV